MCVSSVYIGDSEVQIQALQDSASKEQPESITVLMVKWGTKYGPEYVNRLAAGVEVLI